ncbi:MAG: hypothetical protein ABII13_05670 [Patescibacteria group bacterium]
MTNIFDKIKQKNDDEIKKATEVRVEKINKVKEQVIKLFVENELSVQDASLTLKITQDFINGKLIDKPLSDFV